LHVPDWLPPLVDAARVFVAVGAVELFWILTAWPNGAFAITFAAIGTILLAPRGEQAYPAAMSFTIGTFLTAALAAIIGFALLPTLTTFVAFSLAIGLVLVPAGAGVAQSWRTPMFTAIAAFFCFLLAPTNQMTYDTQQFYNAAAAAIAGLGSAALSFRLLPLLPPALRARRLLSLTLRDLRRLATGKIPQSSEGWECRVYSRFSVLPDSAAPLQRSQLLAALSVGCEIIHLHNICRRLDLGSGLGEALERREAAAQGLLPNLPILMPRLRLDRNSHSPGACWAAHDLGSPGRTPRVFRCRSARTMKFATLFDRPYDGFSRMRKKSAYWSRYWVISHVA